MHCFLKNDEDVHQQRYLSIVDDEHHDIEEFNFDISGHGDDIGDHSYEYEAARNDININTGATGSGGYMARLDEDRSDSPVYGGRYSNI